MKKSTRIVSANDNSPNQEAEGVLYKAGGFKNYGFFQSNEHILDFSPQHIPNMLVKSSQAPDLKSRSLKMSVILWVSALILGLISIVGGTSTEMKAFSAIAILWAGLWTSYVAADYRKWRLSELAIVSSLGGLISAVMIASNYFELNLTLIDGMVLMGILSVAIGYALKSRIALLASICGTLLWAMMSFIGLEPINNITILFPLLTGLQIYSGSRIESKLVITLAIITGYFGLVSFLMTSWMHNLIPLTFASSLLFIIGFAHYRAGKAAEDLKISGSKIHIYTGWIIAMTCAVIFQHFWLGQNAADVSAAAISQTELGVWKSAVILSILAIFISSIIRFKQTQITFAGIFLLTFFSSLIPLMVWFPNWPDTLAASIPELTTVPTFGIAIGAVIVAMSISFSFNGLRRDSYIMFFLGLTFLMIESCLLITPSLMILDNMIVFFAVLVTALSVTGIIAGNNLTFQAPVPRLKHSYS